ncbi:uncharacterized protein [Coffea arabica]|uniref:PWWP domain-containing protein n=1 Tax=Coffea arabica TaxID=13443 RepID=A0ABM4X8C4_COFAR
MACGDTANVDLDLMDLYSRVKLRALTRKARGACSNIVVAKDDKSANAGLRKSSSRCRKRRFSVNLENSVQANAVAVENFKLTSLAEVTEEETETGKNYYQDVSNSYANAQAFDQLDLLLDEGTAVEMLAKLGQRRTEEHFNRFDFGDLVWGKIQSHPWWPGQIFNQALAITSVFSTKREGCVLVAFYGDYTYGWLRPEDLIPFEKHYAEKSKQSNAPLFLTAVKEAKKEIKRRAVLGLACHCRIPANFFPSKVRGYFEVNVSGYSPGVIYSAKQIQKAREDFQPDDALSFLKQLALSPTVKRQNLFWMKNLTRALAYQRARQDKFDKTFSEVFEVQQRSSESPAGMDNAPQAPLGSLLVAEAQEKRILTRAAGDNYLQKSDDILLPLCEVNVSWGCFSGQTSGEHEMEIGFERSICSVSEGTCYTQSEKQLRPQGAPDAGNISGRHENFSKKKITRLNRIKSLARIGANQKVLELQGGQIIAASSIKFEKDFEMETHFLSNYAEPTMLIITFPPQAMLPSISELKDKFACFGPMDESSLGICWKSSACQIGFLYKTNAEAAYRYAIQNRTLFSSEVNYHLQAFSLGASELYKSGETMNHHVEEAHEEIQSQTSLSSYIFSNEMKPALRQLPVNPENILEGCQEEGSISPSAFPEHISVRAEDYSDISQNILPLSSPSACPLISTLPSITEQIGINHHVDAIEKKPCQFDTMKKKNHKHQGTTSANSPHQLINLLTSCSKILGGFMPSSESMAYT